MKLLLIVFIFFAHASYANDDFKIRVGELELKEKNISVTVYGTPDESAIVQELINKAIEQYAGMYFIRESSVVQGVYSERETMIKSLAHRVIDYTIHSNGVTSVIEGVVAVSPESVLIEHEIYMLTLKQKKEARKKSEVIAKQLCIDIKSELERLYRNKLAAGQDLMTVERWKQEEELDILQECL